MVIFHSYVKLPEGINMEMPLPRLQVLSAGIKNTNCGNANQVEEAILRNMGMSHGILGETYMKGK
jgi:hypothetical protein